MAVRTYPKLAEHRRLQLTRTCSGGHDANRTNRKRSTLPCKVEKHSNHELQLPFKYSHPKTLVNYLNLWPQQQRSAGIVSQKRRSYFPTKRLPLSDWKRGCALAGCGHPPRDNFRLMCKQLLSLPSRRRSPRSSNRLVVADVMSDHGEDILAFFLGSPFARCPP